MSFRVFANGILCGFVLGCKSGHLGLLVVLQMLCKVRLTLGRGCQLYGGGCNGSGSIQNR